MHSVLLKFCKSAASETISVNYCIAAVPKPSLSMKGEVLKS